MTTSTTRRLTLDDLQAAVAGSAAAFRLTLKLEAVSPKVFPPTYEGGMAAADQAVATGATAVVTYNDLVAIGLLARLHARGIAVPGDLSVVGIDDIAMSRMARPALTTVRLPKQEAGRIAVELLLAVLDDPDLDTAIATRGTLHGELIVRDSTGPAPR